MAILTVKRMIWLEDARVWYKSEIFSIPFNEPT